MRYCRISRPASLACQLGPLAPRQPKKATHQPTIMFQPGSRISPHCPQPFCGLESIAAGSLASFSAGRVVGMGRRGPREENGRSRGVRGKKIAPAWKAKLRAATEELGHPYRVRCHRLDMARRTNTDGYILCGTWYLDRGRAEKAMMRNRQTRSTSAIVAVLISLWTGSPLQTNPRLAPSVPCNSGSAGLDSGTSRSL